MNRSMVFSTRTAAQKYFTNVFMLKVYVYIHINIYIIYIYLYIHIKKLKIYKYITL